MTPNISAPEGGEQRTPLSNAHRQRLCTRSRHTDAKEEFRNIL